MDNAEDVYCRLCAELKAHNKLINLKTDEEKCREIVGKLIRVNVLLDLNTSVFPKTVCFECLTSLERAFEFVTAVEQAQTTLSELIMVRPIKKENNSDDESFEYEPSVSNTNDVIIKVETNRTESSSKSSPLNKTDYSEDKKKKIFCNSLDALPLSQLNLSWTDYNWMCSYCETQFPKFDELKIHAMQYHNTCNPYRCTDCKTRKHRLDSFLKHVKTHRKYLKFSCYKCLLKFPTLHESSKHKATHGDSNFICVGCNTNFPNEEELLNHSSIFYKSPRLPLQNNSLICKICDKQCKNKNSFNAHIAIHTDRKKDHTCEVCGKCFFQKANLADHLTLHTDIRPYQCEICKATFKTPRRLRLHIGVHDTQKPYACDQCGRCFRLKCQLTNHSIIHTDSLPHVCSYCNKSFRFKTILNQHLRQHTGVKPYSCTICERDFTNWPNYNKHMKRRHDMDMAKKKRTPDGVYPVDPATGEITIFSDGDKMLEWKKSVMQRKNSAFGRSRIKKITQEAPESKEELINEESNNN